LKKCVSKINHKMSDKQSFSVNKLEQTEGRVSWQSPSNIAMIKYWGKKPVQIPMNPSLSFVLDKSIVEITMTYTVSSENRFSDGIYAERF